MMHKTARRNLLWLGAAWLGAGSAHAEIREEVPARPQICTADDYGILPCLGPDPKGQTLNNCFERDQSCVSSSSDVQKFFVTPWEWPDDLGTREKALQRLVEVATGERQSGADDLLDMPGGDAATAARVGGADYQRRPQRRVKSQVGMPVERFKGQVVKMDEAAGYVWVEVESEDYLYDVEALFVANDDAVQVRVASRTPQDLDDVKISLDFERGYNVDFNGARRLSERLRKALRWDNIPVISSWDPRYNNDKKLWFENIFEFWGFGRR
eukprot:gnl/MRDRNA2_/MRDRNA2_16263_c0_seq1.p1 gnl/MRDRNA2_/MRDRNA2_16263_c0~~gnl/MRDRNA2_/MRDRNA2_16263_c0_seq1.p1  ORF type:complete len:269 (+),score=48.53 gnl/MRDRNA2_/MRDRNA2_16263_c0_seq1:229-1035(+)